MEEDKCSVTICDNLWEYTLIRLPNRETEARTHSNFCKDCLKEYLMGDNLNFNTNYIINRRVLTFEQKRENLRRKSRKALEGAKEHEKTAKKLKKDLNNILE